MNLAQFLLVLNARRRIILLILLATVATTLIVSLLMPKEYSASTTLVLNFKASNPVTGQVLPAQFTPSYLMTQADVISSHNVALRVIKNLRLIEDSPGLNEQFKEATHGKGTIQDWLADSLLKKLKADPSRESSVIDITFSSTNPNFAAIVANGFADAYIQANLDLSNQPIKQSSAWYDEQIKQLKKNLEEAQTRMSDYQREKGVVLSDERLDTETARLSDISNQLVLAQSTAFDASSRQREHESSAEVTNNQLVQSLKVQLAQTEAKMADLEKKTGRNYPEYQSTLAQLDSVKQQLAAAVSTATKSVASTASAAYQREADLKAALAAQKAKVLALKEQHDEISVLQSDFENAQHIYDSALQRASQVRLESQANQTDIAILNQATPPIEATSPKIILNLILSIILGSLLAVAVGLVMEMLDPRVRSEQHLTETLNIPVLGTLLQDTKRRRSFFPRPSIKPSAS
jgi:protein tyrosine kinase modulator